MKYFRNNREQAVIKEDDEGRRYYKTYDEEQHKVCEETLAEPGNKIAYGEAGIGRQYPLTEVSENWYRDFGVDWRFTTRNGFPFILYDRKVYTQEAIDHHRALDDIYNDGEPFDDIGEILGDV